MPVASPTSSIGGPARDTRIDVLKGWAILMVVLGHAVQRADAFGLLAMWPKLSWPPYSGYTTMPLFLMVSGYLVYGRVREPVERWVFVKAKMLLIPWAVWTALYYVAVRDPFVATAMPFGDYVRTQLLAPSLWYLVVLFGCYVLLAASARLGDWTLPLFGLLLLPATLAWLPILSWYWWWFIAGYFISKYRAAIGRFAWPVTVALVVAYVAAMVVGVAEVTVLSRVFFGVVGAAFGVLVAGLIRRGPLARGLAYLGEHSLPIYTGEFLFLQLIFVHSPLNVLFAWVAAVGGSLAIEWVLARNGWTSAAFLGGRVPRPVSAPEG